MDRNFLPKSKKLRRKDDDTKIPKSKRLCKNNHLSSTSTVKHADQPSTYSVKQAEQSTLQICDMTEKDFQQSNENSHCKDLNGSAHVPQNSKSNGADAVTITNDIIPANIFNFSYTVGANNVNDDSVNTNSNLQTMDSENSFASNDAVFHRNAKTTSNYSDGFQNNKTLSSGTSQLLTSDNETSKLVPENSFQPDRSVFTNKNGVKVNTYCSSQINPIIKLDRLCEIIGIAKPPKSKNEKSSFCSEYKFKPLSKEVCPTKSYKIRLSINSESSDENTETTETSTFCATFMRNKSANKTVPPTKAFDFKSTSSFTSSLLSSNGGNLDKFYKNSMHHKSENKIVTPTKINESRGISAPIPSSIPSNKNSMHHKSENKIVTPTKINESRGISAPIPSSIPSNEGSFKKSSETKYSFKFNKPIILSDTTNKIPIETITATETAEDISIIPEEVIISENNAAFKFSEPSINNEENFKDESSSNPASENFEKELEVFINILSYQLRLLPRNLSLECQKTMMEFVFEERMKLLSHHDPDDCQQDNSPMEG